MRKPKSYPRLSSILPLSVASYPLLAIRYPLSATRSPVPAIIIAPSRHGDRSVHNVPEKNKLGLHLSYTNSAGEQIAFIALLLCSRGMEKLLDPRFMSAALRAASRGNVESLKISKCC